MLTWIAVVVSASALPLVYVTYRSQRRVKRIEYVVLGSTRLLSGASALNLQVAFNGRHIADPVVTLLRVVNTGDIAIEPNDFHSDLSVELGENPEVLSAVVRAAKPQDLGPQTAIDGNHVLLKPLLLNAGDMLEIQVLSTAKPKELELNGRLTDVSISRRRALPDPPGSGPEGEMLPEDKVMWYVVGPLAYVSVAVIIVNSILDAAGGTLTERALGATLAGLLGLVTSVIETRYLVRRRELWRP